MQMDELRIKRIKPLGKQDVFNVHRVETNGNVYFFDNLGVECMLSSKEYIVVEVIRQNGA
jgi:hypothetical protein